MPRPTDTDTVRFEAFYLRSDGPAARRAQVIARATRSLGKGTIAERLGGGPGHLLRVRQTMASGEAWSQARRLQADLARAFSGTVVIEPQFAVTASVPRRRAKAAGGDTPLPCAATDCMWSLENTRTLRAWTLTPPAGGRRLGEGIRIAQPDTGYTLHPEIVPRPPGKSRLRPDLGHDFVAGRADPRDPLQGSNAHGTATASVVMSDAGGQEPFVAGIAPAAELVPLRVSDEVVHFSFANVTRAIHHAVDVAGAHVISMSLGGPFPSRALADAIERATSQGTIVLAAAGNVWPWVVYPARYPQVVAVAATNCRDQPWGRSASGEAVDVSAPGESVWRAFTTQRAGTTTYHVEPSSGTSYAVATAAGACALWLAFHGRARLIASAGGAARLSALFDRMLQRTARVPAGWNAGAYGAGILDALALLQADPAAAAPKAAAKRRPPARRKAPPPRDPLHLIAEFFAPAARARVRGRLAGKLGATPSQRRRALAQLGDELIFQVATDVALRRALAAPMPPASKRRRTKARATSTAPALPARHASPELRHLLGAR